MAEPSPMDGLVRLPEAGGEKTADRSDPVGAKLCSAGGGAEVFEAVVEEEAGDGGGDCADEGD